MRSLIVLRWERCLGTPLALVVMWAWQAVVLLTPLSLYGIWPDILSLSATIVWTFRCGQRGILPNVAFDVIAYCLSTLAGLSLAAYLALGLLFHMGPRTVPQEHERQGMWLTNQYFRATGAWGCGYGSLTTAKAPVFFPLVEYRTEFEPCVNDDYGCFIRHGSWEACGY